MYCTVSANNTGGPHKLLQYCYTVAYYRIMLRCCAYIAYTEDEGQ